MIFTFHQADTGTKLLAQLSQPPAQALEQIAQSLPKVFEYRFRSMKNRQSVLEQRQVRHFCTDRIDRVRVVMNQGENRIQILFDDKPDAGVRSQLKHAGFRWAPSQGAWQRMLNQNGIYAAKTVTEKWMTPAEQAESTTEQVLDEEPCSEEPALFSYPQQSM